VAERPSAALLDLLRYHTWLCGMRSWGHCIPERGVYCSIGRPLYDAFYGTRRAEVMRERTARTGEVARA
jgi:hypothetical protein